MPYRFSRLPAVAGHIPDRLSRGWRRRAVRFSMITGVAILCATLALTAVWPANASGSDFRRGPDPTTESVAAERGPFATAEIEAPTGHGFNGGRIYYPTSGKDGDTFGAVAIVPGFTARFADGGAWMGPRLASFGFVVIGIETNSRFDLDSARGKQLLAALDYLTKESPVRNRVDPNRLGVIGHSMGGGGVLRAALQRPSLKASVAMAPFFLFGSLAKLKVPTMILGAQLDGVVPQSSLDALYASKPANVQGTYLQLAGADHMFASKPNTIEMRLMIPWLKAFLDRDTRYSALLCPLKDPAGVSSFKGTCPLAP